MPTNFTQLNETGTPAAFVAVNLLITLPVALIVSQFPEQKGTRFLQELVKKKIMEISKSNLYVFFTPPLFVKYCRYLLQK